MSGQIGSIKTGDIGFKNGATLTIEVEKVVVGSTTTSGNGNYSINFSHNGTYKATASLAGFRSDIKNPARETRKILGRSNFDLVE